MSDFQIVKSKRNRKKNLPSSTLGSEVMKDHKIKIDIAKFEKKLRESMCVLKSSEFYSDVKGLVKDLHPEDIVCYGIGNFTDCCIARYQLSLLLLLREDIFKISECDCHFYDPKFLEEEKLFLINHGFTVIQENEEGKKRAERKTLFYMPHCGKTLYNNLLWANWNIEQLSHCIVIGNSFSNIVDRNPRRILEESCWYLLNIQPYIKEEAIPESFQYTDIFNDTSVISFPECKLQELTSQTWKHLDEPAYSEDDVEFIPNKSV